MKAILSLLIGVAIVTYTTHNMLEGAEPWAPKLLDVCFNPANKDLLGKDRVVYTGIFSFLDRTICFFNNFSQSALHDILGAPFMRLMIGAFGTAYSLMAFEGSRRGFKTTLLIAYPIFGLLANLFGVYAVFIVVWIPLSLYYREKSPKENNIWTITLPEAYGALLAIVLGYFVPGAVIASPLVEHNSRLEQELLAIWLVLPVILAPMIPFCGTIFKKLGSPVNNVADPILRERLYAAEGKDALERSYLFLGVTNMLLYFGTYLTIAHQGIRIWDSILMLLNAPGSLPAGVPFEDLGKLLATRTVLVDLIVLSIGFVLWAIFQSGFMVGMVVALIAPLVGPAAAVSFYAYYREGTLENPTTTLDQAVKEAIAEGEKK
ncbi:hypothetical protein CU098_004105 [Rhizopus stolonifer]|uniref:Uncharacterized protein n=1 Tax=Rhizopus stolonifer TaxID=4846 RepID=A0A367JFY1_RHIST|nr:hypothetical protein CU098_004105 [Rhizopus stolonifer]